MDAFGEITSESNATATTIGTSSTDFSNKVQVTSFDTANPIKRLVVPDEVGGHLLIRRAGVYLVRWEVSLSGTSSQVISGAIFANNGHTQLTSRFTETLDVGGLGTGSIGGLADLKSGDTVEAWVQNETAGVNVTAVDASLSVMQIGEPMALERDLPEIVAGSDQSHTFVVYKKDGKTPEDLTGGTSPKVTFYNFAAGKSTEISGALGTAADGEIDVTVDETEFGRKDVGRWWAVPQASLSGDVILGYMEEFYVVHPLEPHPNAQGNGGEE